MRVAVHSWPRGTGAIPIGRGSSICLSRVQIVSETLGSQRIVVTPHYPQFNGLDEAAVKARKKLIATTTVRGELDDENFQRGLLKY